MRRTLLKLIDTLEEDDDVQTVWGNYERPRRGAGEAGIVKAPPLQGRGEGWG